MKTNVLRVLGGAVMMALLAGGVRAQEVPGWEIFVPPLVEPVAIDPEAPPGAPPPPEEAEGGGPLNEADAITTEISELAASLGHDVTQIFLWVRNNIRFTHYYGCKKGATLTYYERSGNDVDQAALLAALLRAAGHTVRYNSSWCAATEAMWADYFGVEVGAPTSLIGAGNQVWWDALGAGNMPNGTRGNSIGFETPPRWAFIRYWVEVEDDGNWVRYDPAVKPFKRIDPQVDVVTKSGHQDADIMRSALLSAAGGTVGTNSISGLNEADLKTHLQTKAQVLGNHVHDDEPNLTAVDAFGGHGFEPLVPASPAALTGAERFPLDAPGWNGFATTELLPDTLMTKLHLQLSLTKGGSATLDKEFMLPELAGRRLTLEFDGTGATNQAVLRLDDDIVASETVSGGYATGADCYLRSTITHPGAANQAPMDAKYLRGARYVLIYAFEAGEHLLRARMGKLAAYKEAGKAENSREVIVESLNVMGLGWLRQTELAERAVLNAADVLRTTHHRFGRMAQDTSFYVDVGQQAESIYRRRTAQSSAEGRATQRAYSFVASAMEHGVLAQTQAGADAVSTVRLVALNNAASGSPETYLAKRIQTAEGTETNWSTVKTQLSGYSTGDLSNIDAVMNNSATITAYVVLPKNGSITRGSWSGAGYVLDRETQVSPTSTITSVGMLISGQLSGGFNTVPATLSSTIPVDYYYDYGKAFAPSITLQDAFRNMAGDPVNLSTGFFTASSAGLTLDSRSLPRGLAFGLSYDGIRRSETAAGVGYGWDFNLNARLTRGTDYENTFGSLGSGTAEQGARLAFGAHALLDLCRNLSTAKDWTVAQLVALWMVDPLVENVVTVSINGSAYQFIKEADGSGWLSPPGSTLTFSSAADNASGKDEVRERHGNVYRFNTDGRLVEVEDPWAKKASFTYDPTSKRLTRVTDAYNRYFELVWDTNNRLDYVSDPQSSPARVLDLTYDAGGHLTTVTDPEGKCDRFEYDAEHRLIIQRDHDNRIVTHNKVFDSQHRVLEQWGQGLESQKWLFRYAPGEVRVTDPANATTFHSYDERGRPSVKTNALGHAEKAAFDGQNHTVARSTPLERLSSATFDGEQNLLTSTASSGGETPAVSTTTNFYDTQNRLKTTTDPRNHVITYGYHGDADGISDPDAKHLPTRVYHTVEGQLIETLTTYNAAGNVETVTDPAGNVTSFEYDTLDRLTYTRLPGPGSLYTQVMSYTAAGDPYQVRDARGNVTTFSYNKRREATGSSTTATTVDGGTQTIAPGVEYDNNRNAYKKVDALGRYTTSTFSATGKLLTTRHSALPGVDLVTNEYEDRDLLWKTTNVLSQTTTFIHDAASRVTDADDHLERNTHTEKDDDGRPLSVRNALNKTSTTEYLDDARQTKSLNPLLQEWTLQTDAAGNLTHRINARSKTWEHDYDAAGRLKTTTSPENRISSATWNNRSLLATATEPSLQSTTLTYDARGRLDDVTGADYALDHAYDANGNLLMLTETTASLGARSVGRTYDEVNRVKTYTNAEGETLKYLWDENGNLRFLEYPDTSRVEYQYDARDRLQYVKESGVTMAEFVWTIANQLKKIIRANGTTRELFYDEANRLERIEERGPDGKLFYYQRCAFDDGDRMTKRLILPAPGAWNEPADTATFDGDNWMTSFNGNALTHDADGNLLAAPTRPAGATSGSTDESTTFTWDARNRVISATTGATARFYTYSPDGNLTHLRTGSATAAVGTRFTVNPHGAGGLSQVLLRTDLATNDQTKVIHGLGVLYEKRPDGSVRWFHYDHLGNTVALTNSSGTVTGRASYSLWGMLYQTSGDVQSTPFLYNGRFGVITESTTGCLHMRARWYNPRIRRFLSADPAGFDGGWNMFAYGNGNPLAMVDPFGLGARSSNESGFWSSSSGRAYFQSIDWAQLDGRDYEGEARFWSGLAEYNKSLDSSNLFAAEGVLTSEYSTFPAIDPFDAAMGVFMSAGRSVGKSASAASATTTAGADLTGSIAASFRNGQYSSWVAESDTVLYRATNYAQDVNGPGRFFGLSAPTNSMEAEMMYNLKTWGNNATELLEYRIPTGTRGYIGPVEGGSGTQVFFPNTNGIQFMGQSPLFTPELKFISP